MKCSECRHRKALASKFGLSESENFYCAAPLPFWVEEDEGVFLPYHLEPDAEPDKCDAYKEAY